MDTYSTQIADYLLTQSWQIAVLVAVVAAVTLALKNRSAHVRYLLWLIVLAKCLVPPLLTIPLPVLPEERARIVFVPPEPIAAERVKAVAAESPAPSATVIAKHTPRITARQWLAVGWFVGASLFVLVAIVKALRTELWLRRERRFLPSELQGEIKELFSSLGVRISPKLWLVEGIGQPFVWGLLRGGIYLPANFVKVNNAEHRRGVLGHELSHILRFDAAVNLLQVIAQAIFWFHPFVWWANRKIRTEREKCCDEMTIARLGARVKDYSSAIVNILITEHESTRPVPSLAVAGPVKNIEERIKTMLRPGKKFYKRPSLVAATTALLIALLTVPTALVLTARGEAQPTTQSADKAAQTPKKAPADSEKPEPPRYTARAFNSELAFVVFVRTKESTFAPKPIGQTPSAAPLEIPPCQNWGVQPLAPVTDWDLLTRELSEKKVPGLRLKAAEDSDLSHLTGLAELQYLDLTRTKVTDAGLEHLRGLSGLRELSLWRTKITDAGLAHLGGLTGLQELWLDDTQIGDAGMVHLKGLTRLQVLRVNRTKITDVGLEHIRGMSELQELSLWDVKTITDAGIAHLQGLTKLQILFLTGTQITDVGLSNLHGLTGLQVLWLENTPITDAGLANMEGMTSLSTLSLSGTQVTDAGMAHLKGLTQLHLLDLSGTQVTDAGLGHLRGLARLQWLALVGTKITDVGLEHLKGLTGLQQLWLIDTQVTVAGVRQLQQSLPKLNVRRE